MNYENMNSPEMVKESEQKRTKIYHITSAHENSITWGDIKKMTTPIGEKIPVRSFLLFFWERKKFLIKVLSSQYHGAVWIITYNTTRYFAIAYVLRILYHWIPAYFFDRILEIRKQKPRLLKLYRKVTYFSAVLDFFVFNEWHFKTSNLETMIQSWV